MAGSPASFCPKCGNATSIGAGFCPKCGSPLHSPAPPIAAGGPTPRAGGRFPRRWIAGLIAIALIVIVVLVYIFGFYLPANNVVTMQGGSWTVNGASSSLGITVGCSNCGQKVAPGSTFTIEVNVAVASETCGFFGCNSYVIQSFSVNAPYVFDYASPNNLPYTEASGSFNTWAITISAPDTAGHFPLAGIVGVSFA
ncbi:MAG TPA: zinc ribbon domain-containing protein [Thermoplasmata archaeon]|nr:zinc ribbon domain-containing protein [Thermoplasmata archaeon]